MLAGLIRSTNWLNWRYFLFCFVFQILNLPPNIKKELAKNEYSKGIPISSTKKIRKQNAKMR